MAESRYVRPVTARELFELHPDTSVLRNTEGFMQARRRVAGRTALLGVYLHARGGSSEAEQPVLAVIGGYESEGLSGMTAIAIPIELGGDRRMALEGGGDATPEELIDTAREATELLDGYIHLSPEEGRNYANMPGAHNKIYDALSLYSELPSVSPQMARRVTSGAPDTFAAAQTIFLPPQEA